MTLNEKVERLQALLDQRNELNKEIDLLAVELQNERDKIDAVLVHVRDDEEN